MTVLSSNFATVDEVEIYLKSNSNNQVSRNSIIFLRNFSEHDEIDSVALKFGASYLSCTEVNPPYAGQDTKFFKEKFRCFYRSDSKGDLALSDITSIKTVFHKYKYRSSYLFSTQESFNYNFYALFTCIINGNEVCFVTELPLFNSYFKPSVNSEMELVYSDNLKCDFLFKENLERYGRSYFNFSFEHMTSLLNCIKYDFESYNNILSYALKNGYKFFPLKMSGVAKVWNKINPILEKLKENNPLYYAFIYNFASNGNRTVDGVSISKLFNNTFKDVQSLEDVIKIAKTISNSFDSHSWIFNVEGFIRPLPHFNKERKQVLKSKGNRAFNLLMSEYEFLNLDEEKYPLISNAIKSSEIPIGTFFRKTEQYFLYNDNWSLWEEMLNKHKDTAIELGKSVSGRSTYEKDLMSYFYFILYALPKYLKRHTGKNWTCIPKLVDSPRELDPPTSENGTARSRSALTPIVNNEYRTVIVPYASLAMPGRQTTYCYAYDYHVLEKGFSWNGNAVTDEIEEKLNGKDDYGLMYYTLTGSSQGRGYPTFLIIFENLNSETKRVHFHRTHPSRSKSGDYNSIHNWIKTCYNWMAGNVNKSLIEYQQGDLIFTSEKIPEKIIFEKEVDIYDNHRFERPVRFCEYAGKENILGYLRIEEDTKVFHTEHNDITIRPGSYVIRQCRSWEANPAGVWSLRID